MSNEFAPTHDPSLITHHSSLITLVHPQVDLLHRLVVPDRGRGLAGRSGQGVLELVLGHGERLQRWGPCPIAGALGPGPAGPAWGREGRGRGHRPMPIDRAYLQGDRGDGRISPGASASGPGARRARPPGLGRAGRRGRAPGRRPDPGRGGTHGQEQHAAAGRCTDCARRPLNPGSTRRHTRPMDLLLSPSRPQREQRVHDNAEEEPTVDLVVNAHGDAVVGEVRQHDDSICARAVGQDGNQNAQQDEPHSAAPTAIGQR